MFSGRPGIDVSINFFDKVKFVVVNSYSYKVKLYSYIVFLEFFTVFV